VQWRYVIKLTEKIFYVFIGILCLVLYRSQQVFQYLFISVPHIFLPFISVMVIVLILGGSYFDRLTEETKAKTQQLKVKLKDTKRLLLHHMDPLVVDTLKEIVRNDMKDEVYRMRNSNDGCS
jgi:hypothetical protein